MIRLKELTALASLFDEYLRKGTSFLWKAALTASTIRKKFRKKAGKKDLGWVEFCKNVLKRDASSISAYIRSVQYVEQHVPDWQQQMEEGTLPPVTLVCLLSSINEEHRAKCHTLLFSGKYSADDFRQMIRELGNKNDGSAPEPTPSLSEQLNSLEIKDPGSPNTPCVKIRVASMREIDIETPILSVKPIANSWQGIREALKSDELLQFAQESKGQNGFVLIIEARIA